MIKYPHRDHQSLDSQAFAAVLSAIFISMILLFLASVIDETPAEPAAIAAAPSQLQCARL